MAETTNAENKVRYNLKNCCYAVITESSAGITYGTVKKVPGAVSLELSQEGGETVFYADGVKYYVVNSNQGYSGSVEFALIPEEMMVDVFGETKDTANVFLESAEDVVKHIAFGYQIDGDKYNRMTWLYDVLLTRPNQGSKTNEDTKEPQTQTCDLTAVPRSSDNRIKATTGKDTTSQIAAAFLATVYGTSSSSEE